MKAIADTLEVSRSNLIEQIAQGRRSRRAYRKVEDGELLDAIRPLVDKRPTYGYRRIMALLNRERTNAGLPRLNHKRIYRVMRAANLLLQPCTGKRIDRVHDGVVQTLRSNMRWCSDGFEIHCWNGEIVRIALVLDTCDREVMAWVASTAGISGEMVRDLMLLSVERRFGGYRTRIGSNGSLTTVVATRRTIRLTLLRPLASGRASYPCAALSPTGCRRRSSRRSSATSSAAIRSPTPRRFSATSTPGSKTIIPFIPTARSGCSRRESSSAPIHHSLRFPAFIGATPPPT